MPKPFARLSPALLALALLVSAAASARAQVAEPGPDAAARTEAPATGARDAQAGGAQQQPTPDPSPQPTPRTPLTADQKIKRAFRGAFLSPTPYALAAFNGGIRQMGEDRLPHKDTGDEFADWGSATARVFANSTTYRLFGNGFYPALFKQDPRYERAPNKGIGRRAAHAVSRIFVTRGDNGNLQPNFSRFAGAATSSSLANVWERSTPGHDRVGADATLKRFGRSFLSGAIGNLVREFLPDIF